MKELETYKLTIEGYDMNGFGVAHADNKVIFVEGAAKDEEVIAKITNVHKSYAFAKMIKLLKPSNDRVTPECPYYGACGGCDMMHINYEAECMVKENKVKNALKGLLDDAKVNPIIKNDNIHGYRNKVMVPFFRDEEDDVLYGFYEKNTHKIIPMNKCLISSDKANEILYAINRYLNVYHISIYNEEFHKGLFKEVMIRHTKDNSYMIVLVATRDNDFTGLVNFLTKEFKEIDSIYLNINDKKTNVVLSDNYKLLYGKYTVEEDILGIKFNVSPASFLQVNHNQCEKLYSEAIRLANLTKDMNVIDAYCGMGSITLNIAKNVNKVYGIEIVPQAIDNANSNAKLNNITNAEFICGKCEEEITRLVNKEKIDVIFFDPPRKGCDINFLNTVIDMKIPNIIYISCNIATAARDIKMLKEAGYELKEVTPTDLFSRTAHVESVCQLSLKEIKK